ncbi:hypothetical protein BraRD5C2_38230 [Bradyrhizobium sp. RD5-C2]|nr:hypothetical protein BraRD5C2_38230 [Bradyrhizobium sp. RD5-C2]
MPTLEDLKECTERRAALWLQGKGNAQGFKDCPFALKAIPRVGCSCTDPFHRIHDPRSQLSEKAE